MTDERYNHIMSFITDSIEEIEGQLEYYQDQIYYLSEVKDKLVGAFNVMEDNVEIA